MTAREVSQIMYYIEIFNTLQYRILNMIHKQSKSNQHNF